MTKNHLDLPDAAIRLAGATLCAVGIMLGMVQDAMQVRAAGAGPGPVEWLCMIGAVGGLFCGVALVACGARLFRRHQDGPASCSRPSVKRRR